MSQIRGKDTKPETLARKYLFFKGSGCMYPYFGDTKLSLEHETLPFGWVR